MRKPPLALLVIGAVVVAVAALAWNLSRRDTAELQWVETPTPPRPDGPVVLRVVHAVNPRLPQFSDAEIDLMLRAARDTARRTLGLDVVFERAGTIAINDLFRAMPADAWRELRKGIVPESPNLRDLELLIDATQRQLMAEQIAPEEIHRFAAAEMGWRSAPRSPETMTRELVMRQLVSLTRWRTLKAEDGNPVIDAQPYHEWLAWSALGYGRLPFDVVITNQLIASAEFPGNSLHSMLRGGVTMGTTFYSRNGPYQAYVMASTFAFSNELPPGAAAGSDGRYPFEEAAMLAGAYLAHELGHMLLRLGHPFANDACVMRPAVMFRFREWLRRLDPAKCTLGSDAQMTPGAIRLSYARQLVH